MDGAIRGLRVGDLAGVDGSICDGFCDKDVGSGREKRAVRGNMVAVQSKSEAEAPTGLSAVSFLHNSLFSYRPVLFFPLDVSFNVDSAESMQ